MASDDSNNSGFVVRAIGAIVIGGGFSILPWPTVRSVLKRVFSEIISKVYTTPKDARFPQWYEKKQEKKPAAKSEGLKIFTTVEEEKNTESVNDRINRCFPLHCSSTAEAFIKNHRG